MDKLVSIIIPIYKSEKFLPKLIESILHQTYKKLEIILVDDESPDKSGEIADYYANTDKRIIVIHKKNGGCCDARNKGMEYAKGDYLMFADGDDWLEPDCIEYLVKIAEENDCEMSTTDAIFTTRDRIQNVNDNIRIMNKEQAVASIINTFEIPVGPWNKLYTMDVIKRNNISFSVPWFGEGLYFSTMNAQYSNKVAVGHRKVYNYRLNNPNSGCTVKEVQNGINSLKNIIYIKECLKVKSKEIDNALSWHIWTNNYNLINYMI
ncbi:glycosyltransferase family 2 protein [Agathobacter sp.]